MNRRAVLLPLIALLCCAGRPSPVGLPDVAAGPDRFDVVVLDPGHGGEDRGARGARGLLEKELVLDVTRRLARRLRERGLHVVMTREGDTTVPLEARTAIANDARADLFISVHANSARTRKARGIEAYFAALEASDAGARDVAARENRAFGEDAAAPAPADPLVAIIGDMIAAETMRESSAFARLVQDELDAIDRVRSRGVKQAPFVVLMGVQAPAALVEIGFLSNPEEERALRGGRRREQIAGALERAVMRYGARYDALHGVGRRDR